MNSKKRICVVDPHPMYREGVVRALERRSDYQVVAQGTSAADAARFAAESHLDLLMIDSAIDGAVPVIRSITLTAKVRVAALTSTDDEEHLYETLHAGVSGYMLKGVTGADLLDAVDHLLKGEPYISQSLASRVIVGSMVTLTRLPVTEPAYPVRLNSREQQVLKNLGEGLTNAEIARSLGVSIGTTKHIITTLFKKLRVRNRLSAILAARNGAVLSLLH